MSHEQRSSHRVGLARLRPLAVRTNINSNNSIVPNLKGGKSNSSINSQNSTKIPDLPDGWFYNETREKDFWEDIEKSQAMQSEEVIEQKNILKKTQQMTDLQDTSSKIRSLVDQFDDIDQDTLMILMQIFDDGSGMAESLDQQMIMNDSKTHVLDFMTQLKGLSDSQTQLMENLRFFFSTIQQHSSSTDSDTVTLESIPDVAETFATLDSLLKDYSERTEQIACLHSDINDYWFKQIANYKRIVVTRDEEIRKLQKTISDASAAAQARRARKKTEMMQQNEAAKNEALQKEQLDKQLRLNQELKQQIETLRKALKEGELQNAIVMSRSVNNTQDRLTEIAKEHDMNQIQKELEETITNQNADIEHLNEKIRQLKKTLIDQQDRNDYLNKRILEIEKERDEFEASLSKHLKLLEIEREKNFNKIKELDESHTLKREELYEAEMRHQTEIRELNERHRQDIITQAEMARQKFLNERQKLLERLEANDTTALIQSITEESEKRLEQQKQEFEEKEKLITQGWYGKLAVLTRQYENRIKSLTEQHEVDLLAAQDDLKYEVKKAEIEFEEKYNLKILELNRNKQSNEEELKSNYEKLATEIQILKTENLALKAQNSINNDQTLNEFNQTNPVGVEVSFNNKMNVDYTEREKLLENYAFKNKIIKEEMDDQMNWVLNKTQYYYGKEIKRTISESQKEFRNNLMELQEIIAKVNNKTIDIQTEKENVNNLMISISNAFENMNHQIEQFDNNENENEPMMAIKEAQERIKALTDRLIQLSAENQDLKNSTPYQSSNDQLIKNLRAKIEYLESLQNGDSLAALERFNEMEARYKHELEVKDQMLLNFRNIDDLLPKSASNNTINNFFVDEIDPDPAFGKSKTFLEIVENEDICSFEPFESEDIYEEEETIKEEITNDEQLVKPPSSTPSAPVENVILRKAPRQFESQTNRRKRKILPQLNHETHAKIALDISEINHFYEKQDNNFEFKSTAFLIDEELQQIIENDVVPQYQETDTNLVKNVIGEVFDRLPISKTSSRKNKSDIPILQPIEDLPSSTSSSTLISQRVSPRQKKISTGSPHLSMIVIQSFSIEPQLKLKLIDDKKLQVSDSQDLFDMVHNTLNPIIRLDDFYVDFHEPLIIPDLYESNDILAFDFVNESIDCLFDEDGNFHPTLNDKALTKVASFGFSPSDKSEISSQTTPKNLTPKIQSPQKQSPRIEKPIEAKSVQLNQLNQADLIENYVESNNSEISNEIFFEVMTENDSDLSELKKHIETLEQENMELREKQLLLLSKKGPTIVLDTQLDPLVKLKTRQTFMPLTEEEVKRRNAEKKMKAKLQEEQRIDLKNHTKSAINFQKPSPEDLLPPPRTIQDDSSEEVNNPSNDKAGVTHHSSYNALVPSKSTEVIKPKEAQLTLTRDISNSTFETDPFVAAKKIIVSSIKYTEKYIDTQNELLKNLNENTEVYDAYITAAGLKDEAHYSFLTSLKQSNKDLESHQAQAFQMNLANDSLLNRINQMISKYNEAKRKLRKYEEEQAMQNVALQKEILSSLATGKNTDGMPSSITNIEIIQKLQSSLTLLEDLGLITDPDNIATKKNLLEEIKAMEVKLTENQDIPQEEIDKLITKTQDFIGGLKVTPSRPESPVADTKSIEQYKKDISRYRKQRDTYKRELNALKLATEQMQQQIVQLNNKVKIDQESHENDLSLYQAQIDSLKVTMSTEGPAQIETLKQQILNMQALIESAHAERDLFKVKFDDAERDLNTKEEIIDQLNKQIEEQLQKELASDGSSSLNYKSMKSSDDMFKDADLERMKEERRADQAITLQHKQAMETALAQHRVVTERCNKLEQKVLSLKQKLRTAEETIDDLNLRLSQLKYNSQKPVQKADKQTQTMNNNEISVAEAKNKSIGNSNHRLSTNVSTDNFNKGNRTMQKKISSRKIINPNEIKKQEEEQKEILNDKKEEEITEAQNEPQFEPNQQQTAPTTNEETIEDETFEPNASTMSFNDEDLDTITDLISELPDDIRGEYNYTDDLAPRVHDPIYIPKKKNRKSIVTTAVAPAKTQRIRVAPSIAHHFPSSSSLESKKKEREADLQSLSINAQPQGKRMLTGTIGPIKPTASAIKPLTTRSNIIYDSNGHPIDVGNEDDIPIIESTCTLPSIDSLSIQSYPLPSKDLLEQQMKEINKSKQDDNANREEFGPYIVDKTLQENPISPLRITLVVHDKEKSNNNANNNLLNNNYNPIVIPVTNDTKRIVTPLSSYSRPQVLGRPINKPNDMSETTKIIHKLREKISKLQKSSDQKNMEIVNLKQKVSELTLAIHRLKLDNIRVTDDLKRSKIRNDNVKNRLDICFKEIGIRDDEIQKLKRELIVLRKQVQPVNQQIAKMQNAQREKKRLQHEEEMRKAVAQVAQNALGKANDSTKKHLTSLLEHQQVTIARLEAQRRMWAEIEKNHMMGVLSAMSLLSTSQYKTVREVLPSYSPFSSSKVSTLKQVLDMKNRDYHYSSSLKHSNFGPRPNSNTSSISNLLENDNQRNNIEKMSITYGDKLNAINRVDNPPFTNSEKQLIVRQNEPSDVEQRIVSFVQTEREKNAIDQTKIETTSINEQTKT